jgi:hypothetical protein
MLLNDQCKAVAFEKLSRHGSSVTANPVPFGFSKLPGN